MVKSILVTGGSGVLGRATLPLLRAEDHAVHAPSRASIDLTDPAAVAGALQGIDAVLHLATRIPPPRKWDQPGAWDENDRLRAVATRVLVDAALASDVGGFIFPSVALLYPPSGSVDEATPLGEIAPALRSALTAEAQVARFAESGHRGVVLRLGLLFGPGTNTDRSPDVPLLVSDAATALLAALHVPSGIYNVVADGSRVSSARFRAASGWRPTST